MQELAHAEARAGYWQTFASAGLREPKRWASSGALPIGSLVLHVQPKRASVAKSTFDILHPRKSTFVRIFVDSFPVESAHALVGSGGKPVCSVVVATSQVIRTCDDSALA
jgi:hypothetical protein